MNVQYTDEPGYSRLVGKWKIHLNFRIRSKNSQVATFTLPGLISTHRQNYHSLTKWSPIKLLNILRTITTLKWDQQGIPSISDGAPERI